MLLHIQDSLRALTESNPGLWAKSSSFSFLGSPGLSLAAVQPCCPLQVAVQIAPSPCSWVAHKLRKKKQRPKKRSMILGEEEEEAEDPCKRQWLSNYQLKEVNIFSLFDEFLEMGT